VWDQAEREWERGICFFAEGGAETFKVLSLGWGWGGISALGFTGVERGNFYLTYMVVPSYFIPFHLFQTDFEAIEDFRK
jgi:hypothetical protein